MFTAVYQKYIFKFNFPGGTSRGVLREKTSYHLKLWNSNQPQIFGLGEISLLPGLSPETESEVEALLKKLVSNPDELHNYRSLKKFPAVQFGIETALLDLQNKGEKLIIPSEFTKGKKGIQINGLVWMGSKDEMLRRLKEKIDAGFNCIKIKVGAVDFQDELELLKYMRSKFSASDIEIRVDANGAFSIEEALPKLEQLSKLDLHSIEQPIRQGQWQEMAKLCSQTPLPIALDEELIGISEPEQRKELLKTIKPQYIILKPSLIGGLESTKDWSSLAQAHHIGWWVTSALEGNIGLNAIAQWTFVNGSPMPQGLGTGQVFSNNIASPLEIRGEELWYNTTKSWETI